MPNEDKMWARYVEDFPEAFATIKNGIRFLHEEKGVTTIYLMGHSMGARMASAFVSETSDELISGLIVVGCRNNGGELLSCRENLKNINIQVLDIWGGKNAKDTKAAEERKELVSEKYKQVSISGANHKFDGYEKKLVFAVAIWLKSQK